YAISIRFGILSAKSLRNTGFVTSIAVIVNPEAAALIFPIIKPEIHSSLMSCTLLAGDFGCVSFIPYQTEFPSFISYVLVGTFVSCPDWNVSIMVLYISVIAVVCLCRIAFSLVS